MSSNETTAFPWEIFESKNSKTNKQKQSSSFVINFTKLLETGDFSDFTITVKGKEFQVHKAILGAQSPIFAAMFKTELKEKEEGKVKIEDVDCEAFEVFLRFIYTGKITKLTEFAMDLFILADKYQINALKELCEESLSGSLSVEIAAETLLLADMHNAAMLKSKCTEFIVKNSKEFLNSKGWDQLMKSNRTDLIGELFRAQANLQN